MSETMVSSGNQPNSDEWSNFDFSTVKVEKPRATRRLPKREVIRLAAAGLFGGASVWLLSLAFEDWVVSPLFCRTPDTASVCLNADVTSFAISAVAVVAILISILAAGRVFRAALISLASIVSLAALWPLLDGKSGLVATIIAAMFGALLFVFFAMIAATKRYALAVILTTVLTLGFWIIARM